MVKGRWTVFHRVKGEEEKDEDDSHLDLDSKDNYDHGDNLDPEELLVNPEEEEEERNHEQEAIDGVKNSYPLGTKIEKEFNKNGIVWNTVVTAFDLETKQHTLEWEKKNKDTAKENNYTGG